MNEENVKSEYGYFDLQKHGTYVITHPESLNYPWEYIYQNRDVLLRVDQFGLVNCQARPPHDIMLFRRELSDRYSKWNMLFKCAEFNGGIPFSNFQSPLNAYFSVTPEGRIEFSPEKAVYRYDFGTHEVETTVFLPFHGTAVVMRTKITNKTEKKARVEGYPALYPYVNKACLTPWDKYEWYLESMASKDGNKVVFFTKLFSSKADPAERRAVAFTADLLPGTQCEISLENFVGCGDFVLPESVKRGKLPIDIEKVCNEPGVFDRENTVFGFPPVYACRYDFELAPNESRTFTQTLVMFDGESYDSQKNRGLYAYDQEDAVSEEEKKWKGFYDELFSKRTVRTGETMFDYYVNTFLPLQMYWTACLDRGWPTGMHGTRDASNDFMGIIPLYPEWSRQTLLSLISCQRRKDGWYPRQVSTVSPKGPHDMRNFCDGGVFVLEFLYEYVTQTCDYTVFEEKLPWLDDETRSPLEEHILSTFSYYLSPENLGEHGLVKIYGGDWLDSVNRAGLKGRGESVMVTEQLIMSLKLIPLLLRKAGESVVISCDTEELTARYNALAEEFKDRLNRFAFNAHGFMNSVFNDEGHWLFSDCDPDGKERVYGPSNYYAIISGTADQEKEASIWNNIEKLRYDFGYKLFSEGLGKTPISSHGRMASGDIPIGLWANGNMYNHGSHGFLGRALTVSGKAEQAYDVLEYLFPYDQKRHPVQITKSAPYAIVNCYQGVPYFYHRAAMPFLTGTVAMSERLVYNWIVGIGYSTEGLLLSPCISGRFERVETEFCYDGKKIRLEIENSGKKSGKAESSKRIIVLLNGKEVGTPSKDPVTGREKTLIFREELQAQNLIKIFC